MGERLEEYGYDAEPQPQPQPEPAHRDGVR